MSGSIIGRIDEMGNRIDDLEKSISDLMDQVRVCYVLSAHWLVKQMNNILQITGRNPYNPFH